MESEHAELYNVIISEMIEVGNWQASVHDRILLETKEIIFLPVLLKFS
jgi:hypothetical protein